MDTVAKPICSILMPIGVIWHEIVKSNAVQNGPEPQKALSYSFSYLPEMQCVQLLYMYKCIYVLVYNTFVDLKFHLQGD